MRITERSIAEPAQSPISRRFDRRAHDTQGPTVSVVIPTLNEAANLPHVFARMPSDIYEIVLVDGFSTDDTVAVARALWPEVVVVEQDRRGKGNALACGIAAATGQIVVTLDADGSADPQEIPAFVAALLDGADFAKGSRVIEGGGSDDLTRIRAAGNRFLGWVMNVKHGTRYSDLCYGYNAFWRHCADRLEIDCDGFEVETLMSIRVAQAKLRLVEVPSYEYDRIHGASNLHAVRDGLRVLRTILRERRGDGPRESEYAPLKEAVEGTAAASVD